MTKLKRDEDKSDGLEITSIGSLYTGPWNRKYWSSSRGKERYPYPVGYQAVRAHNGSTYRMEIREGPKGPLFVITSANGHSSGQTPDIAWDKFQKKYSPRVKIWHGKRFSCNIDGVEFFGFKNPFIQRLLREMVANVSGSAEQSSSFSKVAPEAEDIGSLLDESKSHDSLPHLEKPKVTGKRSRRLEGKNAILSTHTDLKRSKSQDLKYVAEESHPIKEKKTIHGTANSLHSSKEEHDPCQQPSVLPQSQSWIPVQEEKGHIDENDLSSNNVGIPNQPDNITSTEGTGLLNDSQHCTSTGLAGGNLATDEKPLGRLQVTVVEDLASSEGIKFKDNELTSLGDIQVLNYVELIAPDTLDIDQDGTSNNGGPSAQDKVNNQLKEELAVADPITLEGLATEPGEETGTFNSNADSGKSDFDSVGHETAKSMMSFLLPQAIPLLKSSRKKKPSASPLEVLPCGVDSLKENKENVTSSLETCKGNKRGKSIVTGKHNDPLECSVETTNSKDIFCYHEQHVDSSVTLQKGNVSEEVKDASKSLIEKAQDFAVCSPGKDITIPDSIEFVVGMESIDNELKGMLISSNIQIEEPRIRTEAVKTDNSPLIRAPSLVYSRRNKGKTKNQTKSNYTGPLSESIICRSSVDDHVTDTFQTTNNLIAPEIPETGPSNDASCEIDLSGAQPKDLGQSKSLILDSPSTTPKTPQNNLVSAVSQDQPFLYSPKDIENAEFLERLDSQVQKFINKEMVGQQNLSAPNNSKLCQEQGKSFSNSSSVAHEFQYGSDSMPVSISIKKDFNGIYKPIGCYNHPFPIISLTVYTGSTETHICVVCGLLGGRAMTLFVYKVATQEPAIGTPTFAGHTEIALPMLNNYSGREMSVEKCCLQFTPGGHYLVLLDSIRVPYCREGIISCSCSACASGSFEGDALKVVKVNSGYVSVVAELKTVESLQCPLVCEPNYLVAVGGESGKLHLWVMNSAWSAQTEKIIIPPNDQISPGIVELKRVPKQDFFVVGHNGFGEFSLWDISKRILVSKFSGSSYSFYDFLPVGLLTLKKGHSYGNCDVDGYIHRMMAATNLCFSELTTASSILPSEDDIAIWLVISATSDSDAQRDYASGNYQEKYSGSWRLALLVKSTVLVGSTLDPSVAAIGALGGHGIIGTSNGLVYVWEMTTGAKLGTLHHFKGSPVSRIATDNNAKKGAVAIAGGQGQLLVYLPSHCKIVI